MFFGAVVTGHEPHGVPHKNDLPVDKLCHEISALTSVQGPFESLLAIYTTLFDFDGHRTETDQNTVQKYVATQGQKVWKEASVLDRSIATYVGTRCLFVYGHFQESARSTVERET